MAISRAPRPLHPPRCIQCCDEMYSILAAKICRAKVQITPTIAGNEHMPVRCDGNSIRGEKVFAHGVARPTRSILAVVSYEHAIGSCYNPQRLVWSEGQTAS